MESCDGTLAVADEDKLLFSVELEKIHNNQRHMHFEDLNMIDEVLAGFNLSIGKIDHWIIDGWELDPDGNGAKGLNIVKAGNTIIPVNSYCNSIKGLSENA